MSGGRSSTAAVAARTPASLRPPVTVAPESPLLPAFLAPSNGRETRVTTIAGHPAVEERGATRRDLLAGAPTLECERCGFKTTDDGLLAVRLSVTNAWGKVLGVGCHRLACDAARSLCGLLLGVVAAACVAGPRWVRVPCLGGRLRRTAEWFRVWEFRYMHCVVARAG